MLQKSLALLCLIACAAALSACQEKPPILQEIFPRENVVGAKILFRGVDEGATCTFEKGSPELTSLLNALYGCQPAEAPLDAYSPELRSTHRIVLATEQGTLTIYYDEHQKHYFFPSYVGDTTDASVMTYQAFAATLTNEMAAYREVASVPFQPTEEPALEIDAVLRADIDLAELDKPGEAIDYQHFDYSYDGDKPVYAIYTYRDRVAGLDNGYLLFVAAWGQKPTGGYIIDISSIEENDSYYIVRVWHDTPVEGAEVSDQPTQPVSAAMVDARRVTNRKTIVFVNEGGEILGLYRIDREFLDELPSDMPPLSTPDPYEGDTEI